MKQLAKAKVGHFTSKAQINCGVKHYVCDNSKQKNKKYITKLKEPTSV